MRIGFANLAVYQLDWGLYRVIQLKKTDDGKIAKSGNEAKKKVAISCKNITNDIKGSGFHKQSIINGNQSS